MEQIFHAFEAACNRLNEFNELESKLRERYPDHSHIEYIDDSLLIAVMHDDLEITKEIINNYPEKFRNNLGEIESRAGDDMSFLHIAVENKSIKMLELLLSVNMNLNFRDSNGDTAISKAIKNNDYEAVELLKKHNKDLDNEINPYYNIIQYVTKVTKLDSRGSTMASKDDKDISFSKAFEDKSIANLMLKSKEISKLISKLESLFKINVTEKIRLRSESQNHHIFIVTLLLSFDEAKRVDAEIKESTIGAVEGFASSILGLNNAHIGEYIVKYIDPVDTSRLRQVCKNIEKSFQERIVKNTDNQQSR